jgi:hypothetical protein
MRCERCNKSITDQTARIYRGGCVPCHRQRLFPRLMRETRFAIKFFISLPARISEDIAHLRFSHGRHRKPSDHLSFTGRTVFVNGHSIEVPYSILDAIRFKRGFALIYDYMEMPRDQRRNNLEAFDSNAQRLWIAESPNEPAAAYVSFVCAQPLRADNFSSYECTLDPDTGKIVRSVFFK